jgi:hypothetical protein
LICALILCFDAGAAQKRLHADAGHVAQQHRGQERRHTRRGSGEKRKVRVRVFLLIGTTMEVIAMLLQSPSLHHQRQPHRPGMHPRTPAHSLLPPGHVTAWQTAARLLMRASPKGNKERELSMLRCGCSNMAKVSTCTTCSPQMARDVADGARRRRLCSTRRPPTGTTSWICPTRACVYCDGRTVPVTADAVQHHTRASRHTRHNTRVTTHA